MDIPLEDQRAPGFPRIHPRLFRDLKKVFKTETGQVFLFPGSGTGGWEAALTNTLSPGDKVLAARFGQFSHLWVDMCRRLGLEVDVVEVEWGEGVPVEVFAEQLVADKAHTHQGGAGHPQRDRDRRHQRRRRRAPGDGCRRPSGPALRRWRQLASPASTSAWTNGGSTSAVSGSQKGFMLPTGLAIVAVSQKALAAPQGGEACRCYFDFADMVRTNKDGYLPLYAGRPPARAACAPRSTCCSSEGLDNVFARHHRLAEGVRQAVAAWGLKLCAKAAEVALRHGERHRRCRRASTAPKLVRHAYERYNLSLGVGLSKVARQASSASAISAA